MAPVTAAVIVLAVVVVLLVAAGAGLLRRIRELELAVYRGVGLRFADSPATRQSLPVVSEGRVTVLAKVNRQCPVCAEILEALGRSAATVADVLDLVVVSDDPELEATVPAGVRVSTDPAVWRAVDVPFVPALLVVDEHGVVVHTTPAGSAEVVTETIRRATAQVKVSTG